MPIINGRFTRTRHMDAVLSAPGLPTRPTKQAKNSAAIEQRSVIITFLLMLAYDNDTVVLNGNKFRRQAQISINADWDDLEAAK